jgi:hypothetical protein
VVSSGALVDGAPGEPVAAAVEFADNMGSGPGSAMQPVSRSNAGRRANTPRARNGRAARSAERGAGVSGTLMALSFLAVNDGAISPASRSPDGLNFKHGIVRHTSRPKRPRGPNCNGNDMRLI